MGAIWVEKINGYVAFSVDLTLVTLIKDDKVATLILNFFFLFCFMGEHSNILFINK